jgi:hypothetical protein
MTEPTIAFLGLIIVQCIFCILTAWYTKNVFHLPHLLIRGLCVGTFVILIFDVLIGRIAGWYSYTHNFEFPFLLLFAILIYGLFSTNVLLIQKCSLLSFILWMCLLTAVYEAANLYLPVWTWGFTAPSVIFFIVLIVGNCAGAIQVILTNRLFFVQK